MERNPRAAARGDGARRRTPSAPRQGFVFVRSEYPRSTADPARGGGAGARRGPSRRGHPRQRLRVRRRDRGGRGLVRGGGGDRAAGVAPGLPRHGVRAAAVPGRARLARQAHRGPQRGDALQHALHRRCTGTRPTRRSARAPRPARSSCASTTASSGPGMYEVRFGTPVAEICNELGGGLKDGHEIKAVQIGGPLGGILPGLEARHAVRLRRAGGRGLHGRARRHARLRRAHGHARAGAPPARVRRPRELRQVLPVPDRAPARVRDGRLARETWTGRGSRRCSRRSSSARSAPTAAACPPRSAA